MIRNFATQVPRVTSAAAGGTTGGRRINRRLEVDLQELRMMQVLEEDLTLIDVRQPTELATQEQIPGSLHIPLGNLKQMFQLSDTEWFNRFNRNKPGKTDHTIVFYGRGPLASSSAVEIAHRLGYKKSRHYYGGWEEYAAENNLPFLKQTAPAPQEASESVTFPHYYDPNLYYFPK